MSGEKFFYSLMIRESHLDSFNHVNNAAYLTILEEARWEWITQNGYGLDEVMRTGKAPVVLEVNLKMRRELKLRDEITIECYAERLRHRIYLIHQTIRNSAGEVCTEAQIKGCLFDLQSRKMIEPVPGWLKALGLTPSPS